MIVGRKSTRLIFGNANWVTSHLFRVSVTKYTLLEHISNYSGKPQLDLKAGNAPKWDLYAGIVLERKPILTQEMTPLEQKYSQFLSQYELELSKKSDHEIRQENDMYGCAISTIDHNSGIAVPNFVFLMQETTGKN